jgi:hypothetical protein
MSALYNKTAFILTLFLFGLIGISQAQTGYVSIEQDAKIDKLMQLKKEVNKTTDNGDYYRIQLFFGTYEEARKIEMKAKADFISWPIKLEFGEPNYKVMAGKFKTRLEADKNLIEVRKKYSQALLLKPKK